MTYTQYRGIDGDAHTIGNKEDHHQAGVGCFIAAGLYGFFVLLSFSRIFHLNWLATKNNNNLDNVYATVE